MDEFRFLFENSEIDVVCVSETWFHSDVFNETYKVDGYKLYRADRQTNGGGVAIYIRTHITCKVVCKSEIGESTEHLFLDIQLNNKKILVGCVYRPNCRVTTNPLISKLETLTISYPDVIVAGDFNSDILTESHLVNSMSSMNLISVNSNTPTHFTPTKDSLLDLFFISNKHKVIKYEQLNGSPFSKHDVIFMAYESTVPLLNQQYSYRNYKK